MRRIVFSIFTMALLALVAARSFLPEPVPVQEAMAQSHGYNILSLDLSSVSETAGSALIREMNAYCLSRSPTAQTGYTGLLQEHNLILICADGWHPDLGSREGCPTVYRLWQEGVHFTDFYRPDWYQGLDGREFALLTGLVPTNINGTAALVYTGQQDIFLPYALGQAFSGEGYTACASYGNLEHTAAYETLGFTRLYTAEGDPVKGVDQALSSLSKEDPFLLYFVWDTDDCEEALSLLWDGLSSRGLLDNTALCLLTANSDDHRGQFFLWARRLYGREVSIPCSELDITPTLLNLFGIPYDSRLLSGRDVFSPVTERDAATSVTPLVSLYGSAYSDWVTPGGSYIVSSCIFWQNANHFETGQEVSDYVNTVSQLVYDRYIFAREVMENDYFRVLLDP